jgi:hypothetical protein
MTCEDAALAVLLGDDPGAVARAERHRATCDRCGVPETEDVPEPLQSALPSPPRSLTIALAVLGGLQAFMAIPWIVGADPYGFLGSSAPAMHTTRDGVVGLVVGIAAILTAIRPRWARPAFFISSAVIVAQGAAGMVDASIAETGAPEVIHLLGLVIALLIGLSVASQVVKPMGPARQQGLRSVDRED